MIQCQETKPECDNCVAKNLTCQYPTLAQQRVKRVKTAEDVGDGIPNSVILAPMQSTPTVFTMKDMRLFHHFLTQAYPHLPLGNEKVWINDVPKIAHHVRPYLI